MNHSQELTKRCREVFLDGKFIALTNYKELIQDLDWKQATQKVSNFNTIGLLVFHINYYLNGVNKVFEGGDLLIKDKFSFDMSPITSETDWKKMRTEFLSNAEVFCNHVDKLPEEKLDDVFVKEAYGTYRRNINGMIEHAYYHMGQISLLRKAVLS
ncbi:MAG: DUF1572 domain-containing protein [Saprospiraceae bacterium]|nr:DUF1572 domain-containing protein [Saprospiraceae bacterium]